LRLLQESYFVGQQPISTIVPIWSLETLDAANASSGVAALFLSHQEKASDAFRIEDRIGNTLHFAHCSTLRRQRSANATLVCRNGRSLPAILKDLAPALPRPRFTASVVGSAAFVVAAIHAAKFARVV
jgi:hypothetical protein